jgi:hypothetical protein
MLSLKGGTHYIGTTRFNNQTLEQNHCWKKNNNHEGCLYGSPIRVPSKVPVNAKLFILEMNNDTNQIANIGFITNYYDCKVKNYIYSDKNWNRFVYKGKHIIGRNILESEFPKQINILENILFKGCGHYKRGQGITLLSQKRIQQYENELYYLFVCLEGVFKRLEMRNEK